MWDCAARWMGGWSVDVLTLSARADIPVAGVRLGTDLNFFEHISWLPHFWCDAGWYQQMLLVGLFVAAAGLALGCRPKPCLCVCWLLVISLHTRNPFILYGGDHVLRLLLFWLVLLPWSPQLSQRAVFFSPHEVRQVFSPGLVAQMLMIYVFTALHKSGSDWRVDATALQHALSIQSLRTWIGDIVHGSSPPWLLSLGTHAGLMIEEFGPLAIACLSKAQTPRTLLVLIMMAFHLSLALLFKLAFFQAVMIVLWCAFLPPGFWQFWLASRNRCLVTDQPSHRFPAAWKLLVVAALVSYCLAWNISTLPLAATSTVPSCLQAPGYLLRIDQHWGLFSPNVQTEDGWLFLEGETPDGRRAAINGYADSLVQPGAMQDLRHAYRSRFWREYHMTLYHARYEPAIADYAQWITKRWNTRHPDQHLRDVKLYFMRVNSRYSSRKIQRIQIYPPQSVTPQGTAVFEQIVPWTIHYANLHSL